MLIDCNNIDTGFGTVIEAVGSAGFSGSPSPKNRIPMPGPTTGQRAQANVGTNTLDAPMTVSVLVNGAPSGLSATYSAGETGVKVMPGTVALLTGDSVSFKVDKTGTTSGVARAAASIDVGSPLIWASGVTVSAGSLFTLIGNNGGSAPSLALGDFIARRSFTVRRFTVKLPTNTLNGPIVLRIEKNGAPTGMTLTYSAGETGLKTIDVAGVTVVDGDVLNLRADATTGPTVGSALVTAAYHLIP